MKFGGAALATPRHIIRAAELIQQRKKEYSRLIIVVSAMGEMTDLLLKLAYKVSKKPPKREQDMLLSVGERISMALLAMALHARGEEAISLTGSQSGIITTPDHLDAEVIDVKPIRIEKHLGENKIVIVAGFQGVSETKEITTLGRGGSDTSAVALAVALQAERVEFYKDVRGIYSQDPAKHQGGELLAHLSFEEALTKAADPPFVIHPRAILLASKNRLPLHVSSFKKKERKFFAGSIIDGNRAKKQGNSS
ncbi:MAG: aspartate kinase [Simkania negevensis]|nr:aspartate kinase [Simkania negevensis]